MNTYYVTYSVNSSRFKKTLIYSMYVKNIFLDDMNIEDVLSKLTDEAVYHFAIKHEVDIPSQLVTIINWRKV